MPEAGWQAIKVLLVCVCCLVARSALAVCVGMNVWVRHVPCVTPGGWRKAARVDLVALESQCASHRAPRPQRLHQQRPLATHNTARRSPAAY